MKVRMYFALASCILVLGFVHDQVDEKLRELLHWNEVQPVKEVSIDLDSTKVELGRLLFFDKLLSGNKDISCATCHHPAFGSGDGLPLAVGTGGEGLGAARKMGHKRLRIPRNSPEIFNRGESEWHNMFWDGRLTQLGDDHFDNPADEKLPKGLDNLLAAQAMFPVTSRDEMRGRIGNLDVDGETNELALMSNARPQSVWKALMGRILSYDDYKSLFRKVYPQVELTDLGFQHAANAIAAFELDAFTFVNSPWDQYLTGDDDALTASAKRGAMLFYGEAGCANCHSGTLMTDQAFHNIGVPQLGPGRDNGKPYDYGRYNETGKWEDRFAFRTPPLRNVSLTGPWMHNGAYSTLSEVVQHHLAPGKWLVRYDTTDLEESLRSTYRGDEESISMILETLDEQMTRPIHLTNDQLEDMLNFLESLTDPAAMDIAVPTAVPSGLPIDQVGEF